MATPSQSPISTEVFWPAGKQTKGDLFRYTTVASVILPVLADRPLVMKRFPNGECRRSISTAACPDVPAGVRMSRWNRRAALADHRRRFERRCSIPASWPRSQDPWFSRVQTPGEPIRVAIDLDPSDDVPFTKVLDVARWCAMSSRRSACRRG